MEKLLDDLIPIMDVEHDCILSKQGDITVVFQADLPEIFTLYDHDYEAFHQTWVKALRVLPTHSVFHKQDWFVDSRYEPDFSREDKSFLSMQSERHFNERPFLDHSCYIYITKKPANRKVSSSLVSNLVRPTLMPEEMMDEKVLQDLHSCVGQFPHIMEDSGFVKLRRLKDDELWSHNAKAGIIEQYCYLSPGDEPLIKDIQFEENIRIGSQHCQLYTLADTEDLPGTCGSQINFDRYSTDKTKFSIGYSSSLGQLLSCNHIYNQYIFIDDGQKTLRKMETKRLRLQSLAAYSRKNAIALDATNAFLNEAISGQRMPVRAHFNLLVWTEKKEELNELNNKVSAALAQMEAVAKRRQLVRRRFFGRDIDHKYVMTYFQRHFRNNSKSVSWHKKQLTSMEELKQKIKKLAEIYSTNLKERIEERKEEMLADDNSHYLVYRVLGITTEEGQMIDIYQNTGRFLYKYAGSFLEQAATLCFNYKFPKGIKTKVKNTIGQKPSTFEIDFLNDKDALEVKWRDATTDGDHITKEHTRVQVIKNHGYKPIRIMFYYPQRAQAIKIQETLKTLYKGVGGEYYGGDEAWDYLQQYTGVDLKAILVEIADERVPDVSRELKEVTKEIKEETKETNDSK